VDWIYLAQNKIQRRALVNMQRVLYRHIKSNYQLRDYVLKKGSIELVLLECNYYALTKRCTDIKTQKQLMYCESYLKLCIKYVSRIPTHTAHVCKPFRFSYLDSLTYWQLGHVTLNFKNRSSDLRYWHELSGITASLSWLRQNFIQASWLSKRVIY
jgi:hypothetical protein